MWRARRDLNPRPADSKGYFIPAERAMWAASDGSWAVIGEAAGQADPITRAGMAALPCCIELFRTALRAGIPAPAYS